MTTYPRKRRIWPYVAAALPIALCVFGVVVAIGWSK